MLWRLFLGVCLVSVLGTVVLGAPSVALTGSAQIRYQITLKTNHTIGQATEVGGSITLRADRTGDTLAAGESFGIGVRKKGEKEFRIFRRCAAWQRGCAGKHIPEHPGTYQYRAFVFVGQPPLPPSDIRGRSNIVTGLFITPANAQVILKVNATTAVNETKGEAGGIGTRITFAVGTDLKLSVTTNLGPLPNGWTLSAWHEADPRSGNPAYPQVDVYYEWCHIEGGDLETKCETERPSTAAVGHRDYIHAQLTRANGTWIPAAVIVVPV